MKNSISSFRNGKGIRKVSRTPAFILKLMGRFHAKRDIAVAEAFLKKYRDKCVTLENQEVLAAEQLLFDARTEAASILTALKFHNSALKGIPAPKEEKEAADIRINGRNNGKRSTLSSAISSSYDRLIKLNEMITDIDTCLEERILKTRHLCSEKTDAYILGVRYVDEDFSYDEEYSDIAIERYNSKHDATDTAIANALSSIYGGTSNV